MKKYLLSTMLFIFSCQSFAQNNTGIGTSTPNSNAILELSSTNKGLLLPRVADTNAITGTIPAGLLIYSSSDNKLYYYNGGKWQLMLPGSGNYWETLGNLGTVDGTHFIGTLTDVPLNFRVNNQKAGRISNSLGSITAFGYQALLGNGTGIQNSAFGQQALITNTSGNFNTAIGYSTLLQNIGGSSNTAIGAAALISNQSGNLNTATGYYALQNNSTAPNNTALGAEADTQISPAVQTQ